MPDALTNNYSILLQVQGGDSGVWGTGLNNGDFTPIDAILGGNFTTVITSADVTLTTTQFQNGIFVVTGALTGDHNLIIPISPNLAGTACGGKFIVVNNCTGAHNLSVKTAATGSLGVSVPQGFAASLYSDTVNVGYGTSGLPAYAAASNGNPNGQLAGTAGSVNTNASLAFDYANSVFYICTTSGTSGSAVWSQPTFLINRGFDTPVNLSFTTSVSGNALTITALAANINTTPNAANPIIFNFRDATLAKGDPVTVNATGSLSIQISSGATLGASNGVPFHIWITAFNNAGTAQLAVINCSNSNGVFGLDETGVASTQAMTAGATSTGVFYTPANSTATASAFRVIGFLSYETGLVTAGTYNNGPTKTQLFGPGVKKPGDVVQRVLSIATASTNINTTSPVNTSLSGSISLTSAANLVEISAVGSVNNPGSANNLYFQLYRGTNANPIGAYTPFGGSTMGIVSLEFLDLIGTTTATTYGIYGQTSVGGGGGFSWLATLSGAPTAKAVMILREIMG